MAKVLILIQGRDVPGSRYRILQYVPFLEENGVECRVMEFPHSLMDSVRLVGMLPAFDCVFVQKKRIHGPMLSLLRKRARRIVYDFDDAVMYKDSFAGSPYSKTRQKRFADMVRNSDHTIAGNSFLMEHALMHTRSVSLVPTSLDIRDIRVRRYPAEAGPVTIGWIGSRATIGYLEMLKDVWEETGRRLSGKVELKIICDTFFDCEGIPVRKAHWSRETEDAELKTIDIGLMPLTDDEWAQGKCGFKILQYFASGVPAVCSPVGVNRDVVKHGVTGYWASSKEEWIEYLTRLVENPGLRKSMGLAGRALLEQGYTVEVNAPKLLSILLGGSAPQAAEPRAALSGA
jgi:hypothetical protein